MVMDGKACDGRGAVRGRVAGPPALKPHPLLRVVLTVIALLILSSGVSAQCTVVDSPEWRGLKLGMKRKDFLNSFPGLKPINMFTRNELSRVRGFSGLEMLAFRINNDTLILDQLEARYAGLSGGLDRHTLRLTKELKLPHDAWKAIDGGRAEMRCVTFTVLADANTNGFTLTDIEGQKYWDAMRKAAERN